jgi:hypothetical protein
MIWGGLFVKFVCNHSMKLVEQSLRFLLRFSFDALCHHAGGGLGDSTTRTLETDVFNHFIFEVEINGQLIATERVMALGRAICRLELTEVSRLLVVIEDDLLV